MRENFWARGRLVSKVRDGKDAGGREILGLFRFLRAACAKLPSHRILALFRGEKEEMLDLTLEPESPAEAEANGESGL